MYILIHILPCLFLYFFVVPPCILCCHGNLKHRKVLANAAVTFKTAWLDSTLECTLTITHHRPHQSIKKVSYRKTEKLRTQLLWLLSDQYVTDLMFCSTVLLSKSGTVAKQCNYNITYDTGAQIDFFSYAYIVKDVLLAVAMLLCMS